MEALLGEAPAARDVEPAGERVRHRVEVGRDVQAPDLGVVAGVADDRQGLGIDDLDEPAQQLRGAGSAREGGDLHAALSSLPVLRNVHNALPPRQP